MPGGRVPDELRILYPCTHCKSPVRDISTATVCDMCYGFTHTNCIDLPAEILAALHTNPAESGIKFFCRNCIGATNSLIERNRLNADIQKRYEMLQHSFLDFTSMVHNRFNKLETLIKSACPEPRSNQAQYPPSSSGINAHDVINEQCDYLLPVTQSTLLPDFNETRKNYSLTHDEVNPIQKLRSLTNSNASSTTHLAGSRSGFPNPGNSSDATNVNHDVSSVLASVDTSKQAQVTSHLASKQVLSAPVNEKFITTRKTYSEAAKSKPKANNPLQNINQTANAVQTPPKINTTRTKPIYGTKSTNSENVYSQRNFIKKKIFLSTHNVKTTKDYISSTVRDICGSAPFSCVQLRTKYDSYVSFCVTVSEASYNILLDPKQCEEDFLIMPFKL